MLNQLLNQMEKGLIKGFLFIIIGMMVAACAASDPNIETAKLNIKNGEFDKALEATQQAIDQNDGFSPEGYYYKADVLSRMAQRERDVAKRAPLYEEMVAAYDSAIVQYKRQDVNSGFDIIIETRVINTWADEYNAGITVAQRFDSVSTEQQQKGVDYLKNAFIILPDSISSLEVLAEIEYQRNNLPAAIEALEKAIELNPAPIANRYFRLALFYKESDNFDGVVNTLKTANKRYPDDIEIVQTLANTYLEVGMTDEALVVVRELINRDPSNAQYRLVYGTQIYSYAEQLTDSLDRNFDVIFELTITKRGAKKAEATKLQKQIDDLYAINKGLQDKILELTENAMVEIDKAYELDPSNHNTAYTIGIILQNKSALFFKLRDYTLDNDEAARLDEKAKSILKETLPFYKKAVETDPENTMYWTTLFRVYTTLGMNDKAAEAMEKAGL